MSNIFRFLVCALVLNFIACTDSKSTPPHEDWEIIGPTRAGLLTHNVPFDQASLNEKFPGAELAKTKVETYGSLQEVISVTKTGRSSPSFYIAFRRDYNQNPPKAQSIFSVFTRHEAVKGPGGVQVGRSRLKDMRPHIDMSCEFGQNDFTNIYVCLAGSKSGEDPLITGTRLRALFAAPEDLDIPFSEAPSEIIEQGLLTEIMFYPLMTD